MSWDRNTENDKRDLSLKELSELVLKMKQQPQLKAVKISRASLLMFPVNAMRAITDRLYGVPVEIDDSLELFACEPIYR